LEEEKMKEESANDLEEASEAGTKETQEGMDQTGNFLINNMDPTPTIPKDPFSILMAGIKAMLQVAQLDMVQ
jgi:hypothetical protein